MRLLIAIAAALAIAGCASMSDRGWSGKDAAPFDAAEADCSAKAEAKPPGREREALFDACMAGHGWRRSDAPASAR